MSKVNRDDIDKFHDYSLYLPSRTLFVGSEEYSLDPECESESGTDGLMAERLIKNLHILDFQNNEPITIIMNNPGGDETHGYAIYDAIRACKSHVTIKCFGHCQSMGSIIFQAADERVMFRNTRMMIHYGTVQVGGHAKTVQKVARESEYQDKKMEELYMARIKEKNPNYSLSALKKMLDHDTYIGADEAVTLGLCDKVEGE